MRALLDRCLSPSKKARGREPPEGCLAVYVGAARERFVVRTECVNHRLFRALLEEAEEARGPYCYAADGPLELPCDAGAFARAVEAIQREMAEERTTVGCGAGGIVRAGGELLRAGTQASHLASTSASCRGDRRPSRQPRRADQRALPRRRCSGSPTPQAASATPRRKDSSSRLLSS